MTLNNNQCSANAKTKTKTKTKKQRKFFLKKINNEPKTEQKQKQSKNKNKKGCHQILHTASIIPADRHGMQPFTEKLVFKHVRRGCFCVCFFSYLFFFFLGGGGGGCYPPPPYPPTPALPPSPSVKGQCEYAKRRAIVTCLSLAISSWGSRRRLVC